MRKSGIYTLLATFLCLAALASPPSLWGQATGEKTAVGNWVGWAVPAAPFQAPFDQVRFQVTFFSDGTAYWNDGHELRFDHGTGHGAWKQVAGNGFESTFLWVAFDKTSASGAGNVFKLRFSGTVSGDDLTNARLNLTIFPPGTDPLNPSDVGGNPVFGTFEVKNARRVKLDPPQNDISGDPSGELVLGAWWGKALPADPSTAPFPEVVMMLNFMPDHNIVATDVFELASPHTTAHGGPWARTSDGTVHCIFLWTNMTKETDYNGYAKVRITGNIDPKNEGDIDFMTGTVRPTGFATGADVLDPSDPFSGFFGQFNIVELTRVKADPTIPTKVGQDFSANLSSGVWYGKAKANDPTSPIQEIVVMPHFLPNGNVVWNDSQEQGHPHGTGFGNWAPSTGSNSIKAVGVLQKYDVSKANSFGGMYKLKFNGQVDPSKPNDMTGTFELVDFPASAITLPSPDRNLVFHRDPNDTGGKSLGTYTLTELRRIEHQPLPAGGISPPIPSNPIVGHTYLNKKEVVGNWVGWAVPAIPFQAPFDQVRFQVTFFEDGTAYWNDGHELRFGHGTGHGAWKKVAGNRFESTFLWVAFDSTSASGAGNIFKLQFNGNVNGDDLTNGRLNLTIFPPGTDPLSQDNVGGIPVFGTFDVESARRVKLDPPVTDLSGDPTGELVLGAWWGKALPADPSTAPFPEVVMMLNFMPDHNIVATDVFELASPHVTAHGGPWARTADGVNCTFLWTNMTKESDYNGYAKVRIVGKIDANDKDFMIGTVRPTGFATGADVLDASDGPFSGFFGQFNIAELTRVKVDPTIPTAVGQDYSSNLSSGAWYGKAVANDPTSPIKEIVIMPHFLPGGNVVWNDSQEQDHPHGTGFGNWAPNTGSNSVKAVGVLQKYDVSKANSFGGMYKLKFNGQVDPSKPNDMTGTFELVDFPASAITLPSPDRNLVFHRDPNDTGGKSLGTFTITQLRRITPSAPKSAPIVVTNLQRTALNITVTDGGIPVVGAEVALARPSAGRSPDYAWAGTTDSNGKVTIDIAVTSPSAAGYYQARAKNSSGKVIGQWSSIPINGGQTIGLLLPIGGSPVLESAIATTFGLLQNSPNPFNPSTLIAYDIPEASDVQLTVYNSLGQTVRTLVQGYQAAGRYRIEWNGRDELNHQVASGIYYYRLVAGSYTAVRPMVMLK